MQPTRLELEISVAACVLLEAGNNAYHVDLPLDDFTHLPARAVIGAARESTPVDMLLAKAWAKNNGLDVAAADIAEMLNVIPTSRHFLQYLAQLKLEIYKAGIERLRREVQQRAKSEDLLDLSREIADKESQLAAKYLDRQQTGSLVDTSVELLRKIELRIDNEQLLPSGWDILDDLHGGGFLPNETIIIAARPGVGKTAAALQICSDCQSRAVLFSLEMNLAQISPRLLAAVAKQNTKIASRQPSQVPQAIRNNLLNASAELLAVSDRIAVYDQPDQTTDSIRRIARKEVENGARLIVIDYLQLLNCKGDTREQAVSQASRELKNLAKELNVPVFILAQLNRACENEKRPPRSSDLRESGAIEQDANAVFLLHDTGVKTDDGHKKVMVMMTKGRDVGTGSRMAVFNADHQRFYRLANQEEPK